MTKKARKLERRKRRSAKKAEQRTQRLRAQQDELPGEFQFGISYELEAAGDAGFEILAADGEGESALKKFKMTAYTGGLLDLAGFYYPVVVDLSGMRVRKKAIPILRDHRGSQIVGHTSEVTLNAGSIGLQGVMSGAGADAVEVRESAENGFPWEASIGAQSKRLIRVDEGETVEVNGRRFKGPIYVARQSQLKEVSFVAIGADRGGASATLVAQSEGLDSMKFSEWLEANGWDENELSEKQRASLKAAFEAEIAASADDDEGDDDPPEEPKPIKAAGDDSDADDVTDYRKKQAAESKRISRIRKITAQYNGVPDFKVDGQTVDFEAHAIEENWDPRDAELEAMRLSRADAAHTPANSNGGSTEVIEAALCLAAGIPEEIAAKGLKEESVDRATSREYQGYTLHALMDSVIAAAGQHFRGSRKTDAFIKTTLNAERQVLQAGGFTSLSLSGVLANVANKQLLNSYNQQETTWRQWCGVRNNSDFKVHTRYRLDSTGAFKKVGADGELKHMGLSDASFTSQLDTFGAIIALTRQMQINDDLDAFMQLPTIIGRMSAIRVEEAAFVTLLANAGSFFSAGNGNLESGAGSALSIAGLTAAEQAFADQVDSNGKPIMVSPTRLLAPTTKYTLAKQLFDDTKVNQDPASNAAAPDGNPHAGKFTPIRSPYLNNTAIKDQDGNAITGQSDDHWYLAADPSVLAAIVIAFLNGRQVPTIESADTEFTTLGMQWRGYFDFTTGQEDPAGMVRNVGS